MGQWATEDNLAVVDPQGNTLLDFGSTSAVFTAATQCAQVSVLFATPFVNPPVVALMVNSGAAAAAQLYEPRIFTLTNLGFTFTFNALAAVTVTFPVGWTAIGT